MTYAAMSVGINQNTPVVPPSTSMMWTYPAPSSTYNGLYSYDGINYTATAPSTHPFDASNGRTLYANNKFYAFGYNYPSSLQGAYSANGIDWSSMTNIPTWGSTYNYWDYMSYANGITLVMKNDYNDFTGGYFSKSTDNGATWSAAYSTPGTTALSLASSPTIFVSICTTEFASSDVIYYSTDGVTWTASSTLSNKVTNVVYGDGYFYAVGQRYDSSTNGGFYYSTDGINWTAGTSDYYPNVTNQFGLVAGNGIAMTAFTEDITRVLVTTNNGISWSTIASFGNYYTNLYYINGAWVLCDYSSGVYSTNNGATWTALTLPSTVDDIKFLDSAVVGIPAP